MTKRVKCNHLKECQTCQDALDVAVDDMLEGVLGPCADSEGEERSDEEDATQVYEDSAEDTQPRECLRRRGRGGLLYLGTVTQATYPKESSTTDNRSDGSQSL